MYRRLKIQSHIDSCIGRRPILEELEMALKLIGTEKVSLTKALAIRYRDMRRIEGERELTSKRAKAHVGLIKKDRFFTPIWGDCKLGENTYRVNGQHTSYVLAACMQAHNGGLDNKSTTFVENYLATKGGGETWTAGDLPEVKEGQLEVFVEHFECDNEYDLVDCFSRYDASVSTRTQRDILGIYKGEAPGLKDCPIADVAKALAGVLRCVKKDPSPFLLDEDILSMVKDVNRMIRYPSIRDAVRWICESVSDKALYKTPVGAQICCEVYLQYGAKMAEKIIETMIHQIELDEPPGADFFAFLTKIRNRPSQTSVLKKGRNAISQIARSIE